MTPHYTSTAKALHWLMAITLAGVFVLGFYMHDLPFSPQKLQFFSWHKWAGACLFILALARLVWRIFNRPPALPGHMTALERQVAYAGHGLLYGLMFTVPLSGWLMSSAKGFQTVLFGHFPIPDLIDKNMTLGEQLQTVHLGLNLLLATLVAGHAAAALKHHLINRDDVLIRMLPGRSCRGL